MPGSRAFSTARSKTWSERSARGTFGVAAQDRGQRRQLLYLGSSACRQWLVDYTYRLVQDNGIRIHWQDHNFPPLEQWRQNEAPVSAHQTWPRVAFVQKPNSEGSRCSHYSTRNDRDLGLKDRTAKLCKIRQLQCITDQRWSIRLHNPVLGLLKVIECTKGLPGKSRNRLKQYFLVTCDTNDRRLANKGLALGGA